MVNFDDLLCVDETDGFDGFTEMHASGRSKYAYSKDKTNSRERLKSAIVDSLRNFEDFTNGSSSLISNDDIDDDDVLEEIDCCDEDACVGSTNQSILTQNFDNEQRMNTNSTMKNTCAISDDKQGNAVYLFDDDMDFPCVLGEVDEEAVMKAATWTCPMEKQRASTSHGKSSSVQRENQESHLKNASRLKTSSSRSNGKYNGRSSSLISALPIIFQCLEEILDLKSLGKKQKEFMWNFLSNTIHSRSIDRNSRAHHTSSYRGSHSKRDHTRAVHSYTERTFGEKNSSDHQGHHNHRRYNNGYRLDAKRESPSSHYRKRNILYSNSSSMKETNHKLKKNLSDKSGSVLVHNGGGKWEKVERAARDRREFSNNNNSSFQGETTTHQSRKLPEFKRNIRLLDSTSIVNGIYPVKGGIHNPDIAKSHENEAKAGKCPSKGNERTAGLKSNVSQNELEKNVRKKCRWVITTTDLLPKDCLKKSSSDMEPKCALMASK